MRIMPVMLVFMLSACGGSLSDEQRKQMHEKMEESKIVRITEVEFTEAAFAEGRETVHVLDSLLPDSVRTRAFIKGFAGEIRFIKPGESTRHVLEQQLIDAYLADPTGTYQDNVQKVHNPQGDFDTLLYTKPVIIKRADGVDELVGVWNIWLPKKALAREIGKERGTLN